MKTNAEGKAWRFSVGISNGNPINNENLDAPQILASKTTPEERNQLKACVFLPQ